MKDIFDDFDVDDFMNKDSFEDSLEGEMDEPFACDAELDDDPIEDESQGYDLTAKDAFILGGAMGFGYEEL